MATVRYVGIHDAVEVEVPLGGVKIVERDGVLETSDDHAAGLLQQPTNWEPVRAETPPKRKDADA